MKIENYEKKTIISYMEKNGKNIYVRYMGQNFSSGPL